MWIIIAVTANTEICPYLPPILALHKMGGNKERV